MEFSKYSIRIIEMRDLENFYLLVQNNRERLEDFFTGTVSKTRTFENTKNFVAENIQKATDKTYFPFIIEDIDTHEIIGFIDVKNIDWNIPKGELGCYTDRKFAGKGLTTQAFSLVVDHCFEAYKFKKLFLRTHESNIAAQRLAERNGFEIEGKIRKDYKTTRGEIVDLIYYGKLANDE